MDAQPSHHDLRLILPALTMWLAILLLFHGFDRWVVGIAIALLVLSALAGWGARYYSRAYSLSSQCCAAVVLVLLAAVVVMPWRAQVSQTQDFQDTFSPPVALQEFQVVTVAEPRKSTQFAQENTTSGSSGSVEAIITTLGEHAPQELRADVEGARVLIRGGAELGNVTAGSTVQVQGSISPSTKVGREQYTVKLDSFTVLEVNELMRITGQWRHGLRQRAGSTGELAAQLIPGMAIGDKSTLGAQLEDDMRVAGLSHILTVSGANCTYVMLFVIASARVLRLKRSTSYACALSALLIFVLITRLEPSIVRAAVMGLVAVVAVLGGRRKMALHALAFSVIVLLGVDPYLAQEIGFALSVAATASLVILAPGLSTLLGVLFPPWLAGLLAIPVAAQLGVAPILLLVQPWISVYSVLANALVAPVVPAITIVVLASMALALLSEQAAQLLLHGAGYLAEFVGLVAQQCAAQPSAVLQFTSDPWGIVVLGLISVGIALAILYAARGLKAAELEYSSGYSWRKAWPLCTVVLLLALCSYALANRATSTWDVLMCDVGQGDTFAVRTGEDSALVIDTGPNPNTAARCLARHGVHTVSALLLTHDHQDHIAGTAKVLDTMRTQEILYASSTATLPSRIQEIAQHQGIATRMPAVGESLVYGRVKLRVLNAGTRLSESEQNNSSLVVHLEYSSSGERPHRASMVFGGDLEAAGWAQILPAWTKSGAGPIDLLKVAHHGSRGSAAEYLHVFRPRVALISSGEGNSYGHPHQETLDTLSVLGTQIFRSDRMGDVTISFANQP